jgi:ATP-binding cassette subfamily B protein
MQDKHSDIAILRKLLRQARPFWPHIGSIFLLDLLATPLALLSPLALKLVVDNVLGAEPLPGFLQAVLPTSVQVSPTSMLVFAACLLVAVSALTQLQVLSSTYVRTYTGEKLVLGFRSLLLWHGQQLSLAFHDRKGVTHSLYRVQYDSLALQNIAIDSLIPMFAALVTVAAMLVTMANINLQIALVALVVVPVLLVLIKHYRNPLREGWRNQKKLDSAAVSIINEVFSSLRVVKAFTQEQREQERYTHNASKSLSAKLGITLLQGSFSLATGITTAIGTGVVLYLGVNMIQAGKMSIGDLLVVMTYLGMLYSPLTTIGNKLAGMQNAFASAERAFDFLDEQVDVPERDKPLPLARSKGAFRLDNVSFEYEPGYPVLQDIFLDIPAGSRVGIAGKTGAGKSTLMSLLMRFYDPTAGRILLDGTDLRDYRLADLRSQFGIVLQEPVLFSNSIADNIAYGRPDADEDAIIAAARAANASDFIEALPNGYDTLVGERGMRLSGGERQRIALARAFLRDAPVLLLDEPTSSVDVKTEALIMEAMERLMQDRTTFMIAHRLSTLDKCDVLLEIRGGRIVHVSGESTESSLYRQDTQLRIGS